ncbi:Peptidase M20, carboxypeptidase S [Metarhizium album ARSEF 1941]|uniref:Peptidase M20, carboxypeptidase S n=1 Tax=Metarhizium album (strain ARSEF 1941) TaxID=1081103 RepID=A0A0B2WS89_METAS|nr:Peptidase M20, carboxypeptidase S [Metarhizium album ARSEF 1941]KHN98941.1 Peptidase M20, carboxypeptidase S [Metarhizium album ARSEF 1941]
MAFRRLSLLAAAGSASAFVSAPIVGDQLPLAWPLDSAKSTLNGKCQLPPVLDPSEDGLPSANALFSSRAALDRQVRRHQAVVRVPSVCYDDLGSFDEDARWKPFHELHRVLAETYPAVHAGATVEKVNSFGLVYTIPGSKEHLKPILLAAHQDVVPVADENTWTHPPFSGHWDGEWLWGRGSLDDKMSLTAIMSTMETLLSRPEWQPARTIILAFGFDEECSGHRGAGKIAEHLGARYGKNGIAMILDEGDLGLNKIGNVLYALPAVYEKGNVNIWLELRLVGGHSSVPLPHTGIGIISEMVVALEAHPYRPKLIKDGPIHQHLLCQAQHSPDAAPELTRLLGKGDLDAAAELLANASLETRYMIQTSQAVDFIGGGQKINALPEVITLGVNYRVAPQDSIPLVQHNVVKHIRAIVSKYNLKVKAFEGDTEYEHYLAEHEAELVPVESAQNGVRYDGTLVLQAKEPTKPSPISPVTGAIWDVFAGTIRHTFAFDGTVVPAGEAMTGNTDTRHYVDLTPHVYRWSPVTADSMHGLHTVDERIRMDTHMDMVKFYYDLVRNFDASEA